MRKIYRIMENLSSGSQDKLSIIDILGQVKSDAKEKDAMDNKEQDIRHLERRIAKHNLELEELRHDEKVVKNHHIRETIISDITRIERYIEQKEFRLWKLSKEEL